jgi:hypothetical protein
MPAQLNPQTQTELTVRNSVYRGIGIGLALAVGINILDPIAEYQVRSSTLTISHFPLSLFFSITFLALILNPILRRFGGKGLSQPEILIALAVGFVGSSVARIIFGLIATISVPFYFATPENQWMDYAEPYLKPWLFPTNDAGQMEGFYTGLPEGSGLLDIPWAAWIGPLFWWLSFVVAMLLACVFAASILRKQWVESERLPYPMAQIPIELTAGGDDKGFCLPEVARSGLFWAGLCVPLILILWNTISYFTPRVPAASFITGYPMVELGRDFPAIFTKFDFYVIGFAYFTSLEILFSIWVFHLVAVVVGGMGARIGMGTPAEIMQIQNGGGLLAFILWGIWLSRHRIRDACRKAFNPASSVSDEGEFISHRVAVFGSIFCFVFMNFWLIAFGLSPWVAPFYLILGLLIYLAMAKVVAATGLVSVRFAMGPGYIISSFLGIPILGIANRHILALMVALNSMSKGFVLPAAANAVRLGDAIPGNKRKVGGALIVGGILALAMCAFMVIVLAYGIGAQNFGGRYTTGNRWTFNFLVTTGLNPMPADWKTIRFFLLGGIVTTVISYLTYRFPWWPLHPVGSAISFVWPVRATAFSVFVAWLIKKIVLQIGGGLLYRKTQKFFLGLLVGYAIGVIFSFGIDAIWFMGDGHEIHSPPM